MAHSGAATPTYAQPGQRYVSGGAVPYSQWAQNPITPQQQPRGASYDQKPMIDGQGQQANNPQQQAYMQHVEMIEQHKAVEAHQRLMAQRNEQMVQHARWNIVDCCLLSYHFAVHLGTQRAFVRAV